MISYIDKNTLFDAVRPEIVAYAKNVYATAAAFDAYKKTFQQAYSSTGGIGEVPDLDYESQIANMRKKKSGSEEYRADIQYAHWFFYFSLTPDECTDPHYGRRISEKLFDGENFYDQFERDMRRYRIPRPSHIAPSQLVRLGPVTISLSYDVGLRSISIPQIGHEELVSDGQPNIFKALNWRSGLTSLHGRTNEYDRLLDWALDNETLEPKLMLVSGPGGVGKSRLVNEVATLLIGKHGWSGGLLPAGIRDEDVFDGSGKGVVLIIDYPEERSDIVKKIFAAMADDTPYDRPVRIILASREGLDAWRKNFNDPDPERIEEIYLGASPYLSKEHALQISDDVAVALPELFDLPKPRFEGVEEWLNKAHSHRFPLMILAASVHGVLEPREAFTLSGKDVLLALAAIELQRVRSYSKRDLSNERALEKLLALSLFTADGLSKNTVFELGAIGICPGMAGHALLEAVQNTPFWRTTSLEQPSGVIRIEPDRFAAAILYVALSLEDPSPALPEWLSHASLQGHDEFGAILARIAFDLGHLNADAGATIERAAVEMLSQASLTNSKLRGLAFCSSPVFSTAFSAEICKNLLKTISNKEKRAPLLNNVAAMLNKLGRSAEALGFALEAAEFEYSSVEVTQTVTSRTANSAATLSNILGQLGRTEEALQYAEHAATFLRNLLEKYPTEYRFQLANSLNDLAKAQSDSGNRNAAIRTAEESLTIHESLAENGSVEDQHSMAMLLKNLASWSRFQGQLNAALRYSEQALSLYRSLAEKHPEIYIAHLGSSLNAHSTSLTDLGQNDAAVELSREAVNIFGELTKIRPEIYSHELSQSMNTLATCLNTAGRHEEALECAERSVKISRDMVEFNPVLALPDLGRSLTTFAILHSTIGQMDEALEYAQESVRIRRDLVVNLPEFHRPELAVSLANLAKIERDTGLADSALTNCEEAIEIVRDLAEVEWKAFQPNLANLLLQLGAIHSDVERWEEAATCTEEALTIYLELSRDLPGTYLRSIEMSLTNLFVMQSKAKQNERLLQFAEKAVVAIAPILPNMSNDDKGYVVSVAETYLELCGTLGVEPSPSFADPVAAFLSELGNQL